MKTAIVILCDPHGDRDESLGRICCGDTQWRATAVVHAE